MHTEQTGQAFASEALEAVWTQTRGQPWLVNALAHETCFKNRAMREDRSRTVTADDIAAAREKLIVNRVTHLDYLADKLREERVRRVIEPMLSGTERHTLTDRDVGYARDLGLLARDAPLRVANPIYAQVLPRELAWVGQETLELSPPRYVKADGSLDAELLMAEFQGFFRRHSEHWRNRFAYARPTAQRCREASRRAPPLYSGAGVRDCGAMIRVVLTDLDGVIRQWPAPFAQSVEDRHGLERGSLARAAFDATILGDAITGRITDSEWRERIARRLGSHTDPATATAAVAAWSASPGVVEPAALGVIQKARAVAAIGLVTNATTRLADDLSRLALADAFDFIVNSAAIGCAKPSACFYEHALRRCECDRGEVLFVDDRYENVAAAIDFGFRGHHYRDPRTLQRVLRGCGVIR